MSFAASSIASGVVSRIFSKPRLCSCEFSMTICVSSSRSVAFNSDTFALSGSIFSISWVSDFSISENRSSYFRRSSPTDSRLSTKRAFSSLSFFISCWSSSDLLPASSTLASSRRISDSSARDWIRSWSYPGLRVSSVDWLDASLFSSSSFSRSSASA